MGGQKRQAKIVSKHAANAQAYFLVKRAADRPDGNLVKLLTQNTYDLRVQKYLEEVHQGLLADFACISSLKPETADRALAYLLELSCQAQNVRNIILGREFLLEADRAWLVSRIEAIALATLNLDDEWEYPRLLELYTLLDDSLAVRLVALGQTSSNVEIVEAAAEFAARERRVAFHHQVFPTG